MFPHESELQSQNKSILLHYQHRARLSKIVDLHDERLRIVSYQRLYWDGVMDISNKDSQWWSLPRVAGVRLSLACRLSALS